MTMFFGLFLLKTIGNFQSELKVHFNLPTYFDIKNCAYLKKV